MKKAILSLIFLISVYILPAQVIIDQNDMPNIGDTIRIATYTISGGTGYTQTGAGYSWNFSNFSTFTQRVDTFLSVLSTPLVYIATFNNPLDQEHKATIAGTQPDMPSMPNIQITEVYNFFKETSASYAQVGFGAKFNGNAIPVQFNDPDVVLKFPLTYGSIDSCDFYYNLFIPTLGYYGESKHRVNYVDGWGTIITPLDTFEVMRVRSDIQVHDTIYIDSYGFGFTNDHTETEYKWYADTMSIPVMKITKRTGFGSGTTAEYIYKTPAAAELSDIHLFGEQLLIYPNPTTETINYSYYSPENSSADIVISDSYGNCISNFCIAVKKGKNCNSIDIRPYSPGIYFIQIHNKNSTQLSKFVVQ